MAKIDIVSGFLGAGKTTLIKKLLSEAFKGEKLVLIENEFGEIGIDGGFLKDAGIEVTEMNSGCICCSLVGDFGTALSQVLEKYTPDRIIIEPSGVGKLSDVIKAVKNLEREDIKLNSFVAVADAGKCKMYMKNFGEFFNNQIEYAGTIVLSRTQKISEEKLAACVEMIRSLNTEATVITTPWDDIDGAQILAAMEKRQDLIKELIEEEHEHHHHHEHEHDHEHHHEHDHEHEHEHHHDGECCHHDHDHHHHHADEVFSSWGVETPRKFTKQEVENALKALSESEDYGIILRSKGMLPDRDGGWIYFDMVPEEYEIREGQPDVTGKICVIGSKLKEDELKNLFCLS